MTKRLITIVMLLLGLAVFSNGCSFQSEIKPLNSSSK